MEGERNVLACAAGQVDVSEVPEEIRILPFGMVHNTHQDFMVDDESCQLIIRQFKERRIDLVIDYEHQTLKNIQAPAGGWIKDIRRGEDALVAKVEWTQKAKEYLANKEYRYLSPVVMVRKSDHKAVALHSAALTNTPAIDGMFAIVNSAGFPAGGIEERQGGKTMEFLQKLAAALGLPDTATEADVINAVEALTKKNTEVVANSTVLAMLGLEEGAKTEDVAAKIQQLSSGNGMEAELAALKENLARRDAAEAVAAAMKEGKVSAAQKEWAEGYALKDPEGFAAFCEKAVPVVPMGKVSTDGPKAAGKRTGVDAVILKNLGLTQEDVEKYADREE